MIQIPTNLPQGLKPEQKLEWLFRSSFLNLLSLPEFRLFMTHVALQSDWSGAFGDATNTKDANATYRRLGEQAIGKKLIVLAQELSPDLYWRALKEAGQLHTTLQAAKD